MSALEQALAAAREDAELVALLELEREAAEGLDASGLTFRQVSALPVRKLRLRLRSFLRL